MPENQMPARNSPSDATPGEFNFVEPTEENSRLKRRSLKVKSTGLVKPAASTPEAARELEREAPPLSSEQAKLRVVEASTVKAATTGNAPPRTTPTTNVAPKTASGPATTISQAATETAAPKTATSGAKTSSSPTPAIRSTATPSTSPHGTRPATLYYSSPTSKAPSPEKEAPSTPMKTIPTASSSSTASASSTAAPASAARATTASTSRPASTVDYRANVERQSREQKSVGSILSYIVYALIAFFVISAALAGYGAHVIFKQLDDQSVTVSDLDKKYSDANKDLQAKLATTQDALAAAQAQIQRQQEVIVAEQTDINKLIAATNDNSNAIKAEKTARAAETANLRSHVRDLESRSTQKY